MIDFLYMFSKTLQDLGLSEKEAQVYLALLEVDNDSIIDISKKTEINRTTIYPVIEGLLKKGLVSEVQSGKKIFYHAESPERLETYVERQKLLFEEKSRTVKDIIPQLKATTRDSGERPVIKMYEGHDGIVSSVEDFYVNSEDGEPVYAIYSRDLVEEIFSETDRARIFKKRKNLKIPIRTVYTYTKRALESTEEDVRVRLDHEKYNLACDISITGDATRISTIKNHLSSFLIKNKDVADTLRSIIRYVIDTQK